MRSIIFIVDIQRVDFSGNLAIVLFMRSASFIFNYSLVPAVFVHK